MWPFTLPLESIHPECHHVCAETISFQPAQLTSSCACFGRSRNKQLVQGVNLHEGKARMIEHNVPKTSLSIDAKADEIYEVIPAGIRESKGSGSGTPDPSLVAEACKRAHDAGSRIAVDLGSSLGPSDRRKVLITFRRTLFPAKRPGRRRKDAVTAAHRDWKNGVRGLALYRAHIPGWDKHHHYRRQSESRALMDAIRSRERRERERTARGDKARMKTGISQSGGWSS